MGNMRTDQTKRNSWISETNDFLTNSSLGYFISTWGAEWVQSEHQEQAAFNSTEIRTCQKPSS